jgi:hypothetical protein
MITKCNNFTSTATDAATKTIMPLLPTKTTRPKKKLKSDSGMGGSNSISSSSNSKSSPKSFNMRFVPVDPIKHAPSIITASIETAQMASNKEFSLEFCAREKTLPYAKMIHNRMLLSAIDFNLQHVDIKAVFLLAEATVWLLKNIIQKISSRSKFRQKLRVQYAHEKFMNENISDERVRNRHRKNLFNDENFNFDLNKNLLNRIKAELSGEDLNDIDDNSVVEFEEFGGHNFSKVNDEIEVDLGERASLNINNIVPVKKLNSSLYDLKNLLQVKFIFIIMQSPSFCHQKINK